MGFFLNPDEQRAALQRVHHRRMCCIRTRCAGCRSSAGTLGICSWCTWERSGRTAHCAVPTPKRRCRSSTACSPTPIAAVHHQLLALHGTGVRVRGEDQPHHLRRTACARLREGESFEKTSDHKKIRAARGSTPGSSIRCAMLEFYWTVGEARHRAGVTEPGDDITLDSANAVECRLVAGLSCAGRRPINRLAQRVGKTDWSDWS